jgi:hypothetical protein
MASPPAGALAYLTPLSALTAPNKLLAPPGDNGWKGRLGPTRTDLRNGFNTKTRAFPLEGLFTIFALRCVHNPYD